MCGLFGWNIKRKSRLDIGRRECMAAALACANSTRGDKSWGAYVNCKQGVFVRREVGDIASVSDFAGYGRMPLVMAHTRQPTQGAVKQKNAHPFSVGKITLAHNGVIINSDALDRKYNRHVRVDSQHLALHLNEGLPFTDIEGYGAITWINSEFPERVYICRLSGGSLSAYYLEVDHQKVGVVWSSDYQHLRGAIGVARLDAYPYNSLDDGKIYYAEGGIFFESKDAKLELAPRTWHRSSGHWDNDLQGYVYSGGRERGYWVQRSGGAWTWIDGAKFPRGPRSNTIQLYKGSEDEEDAYTKLHRQGYMGGGYYGGE